MAAGLYQCTALQSRARPADRSGSHYRNGFGVVSLSQNLAEETQRVIHGGAPFHSASASPTGYAPAERNSVLSTLTSLGVGQIKPPKWARPTCQKHNGVGIDECCLMSYGLHLVHTPAHDHGDRSHVIAAPWNVPGRRSPRAHSRPTSATALCGFREFLSHVRRNPRGGVCHPAPNSAVSFYRNRWPAHIHELTASVSPNASKESNDIGTLAGQLAKNRHITH